MNCDLGWTGFFVFLSVILYVDYRMYLRSGDSIFFEDKIQIEKDLREIQKLEIKQKLDSLINKA